ncbi:MAG: hypothetical protein Q4G51_13145 [Dermatophilus congolensis]|nr:hypothetical protein [Dermatophilus congolensis]
MGNTPSTTRRAGAAASAAALAAGLAMVPVGTIANAASQPSSALARVVDGCGRVDSLEITGTASDSYTIYFPGLTMADPKFVPTPTVSKVPQVPAEVTIFSSGNKASWARTNTDFDQKATKGLPIKIMDSQDRYVPITTGDGARGTEGFLFTNEDCATPIAPTFDDRAGFANDTVTIPQVYGVKYSGKAGTTAAKGTVTVSATAEAGFRLANRDGTPLNPSQTTWSHTFDASASFEIPEDKAPTFRRGAKVTKTVNGKTTTETEPNVVIVHHVPGVTWVVDGKPTKTTDKTPKVEVKVDDKLSVVVEATSSDAALYKLGGTTSWTVGAAPSRASTVPVMSGPPGLAGTPNGRAGVRWSVPFGVVGDFTYDVQYRTVALKGTRRVFTPWKNWAVDTPVKQGTFRGQPGGVYEVRSRSIDSTGKASAWSRGTRVVVPLDITTGPRPHWKRTADKQSVSGTLVTSTRKGATWTTTTPATDRVTIWYSAGPMGGKAKVYIDGKHRGWIGSFSRTTKNRQTVSIPTTWGRHTVKIVNDSTGRRTQVALDGIAYNR